MNGRYDAVVVGAGPAGSAAALALARLGRSVLLVDRAAFPRAKVCGCCINPAALATLERIGAGDLPHRHGARPITHLRLAARRRAADLALPGGVSLSRSAFDHALCLAAQTAGAAFCDRTSATLGEVRDSGRVVTLPTDSDTRDVEAAVVIAADGLGGSLLDGEPAFRPRAAPASRMGLGAVVRHAPAAYDDGAIHMAVAARGYVGLVRLEDGSLDIAAAIDPAFTRASGGPACAVAAILDDAGFPPIPGLGESPWRGTPLLTRHRPRLAAHRLFVIGDAAGYVEPFTGEGIAWALASGEAVAPLAAQAARAWSDDLIDRWHVTHRRLFAARYRSCHVVTRMLRFPRLTAAAVAVLSRLPGLASPVVRAISRPVPA